MAEYTVLINGASRIVDVDPETPLLWVLRDHLGLTGTKFGCGIGVCGACTVHVDGAAVRSCSYPIGRLGAAAVTTIEAFDERHPLVRAWATAQVPQCGYCQPGMVMAAAALLSENPGPDAAAVRAGITNLCRCGSYHRVEAAVLAVAAADSGGEGSDA